MFKNCLRNQISKEKSKRESEFGTHLVEKLRVSLMKVVVVEEDLSRW